VGGPKLIGASCVVAVVVTDRIARRFLLFHLGSGGWVIHSLFQFHFISILLFSAYFLISSVIDAMT
jgi:hypothetical protein